ncbi:MAG: AI-2E family transporter [Bacteroidota bacterium]
MPARQRRGSERRPDRPETILLAAGTILLGILCYTIVGVLSPFVAAAGLLVLLYPFRQNPVARQFMKVGILLFAVWFLASIAGLLAPFAIAFLLAYILNPLVELAAQRRVPRWVSSLVILLLLLGAVVAAALFVVPVAVEQLQAVIAGAGNLADATGRAIESGAMFDALQKFGVTQEKAREAFLQHVLPKLEEALRSFFGALFSVVTSVTSVAQQILNIVIIPFVLFYLLKDFPAVTAGITGLVPRASREAFLRVARNADALMGRYFRGAILVALIQGAIAAAGLWLIGVQYAFVLGLMTAILDFFPYVGLVVSLVVASIVALFSGGSVWTKVLLVVVLYLGQKLLEATVLGPKIIGTQVGLHPVLLILCLLVFGYFLGLVGLLIAVPVTGLAIALVRDWDTTRRRGPQGAAE